MRVSSINSAHSFSFARRNKHKETDFHQQITYDVNKVRTALICTSTLALAGITYALIKDSGNNSVKSAYNVARETAKEVLPDPVVFAVGKRRDAVGVMKYNKHMAKVKLENLEKRFANGEFKDLPEHAIKNIQKQKVKLIHEARSIK